MAHHCSGLLLDSLHLFDEDDRRLILSLSQGLTDFELNIQRSAISYGEQDQAKLRDLLQQSIIYHHRVISQMVYLVDKNLTIVKDNLADAG